MNAAETADLAATYATLLTDKEMEVRLSAVKEIEKVARSCGAETFSECVLPVFDKVFEFFWEESWHTRLHSPPRGAL